MKVKVFICVLALILVVVAVAVTRGNKTELISYQIVNDMGSAVIVYVYTNRNVEVYSGSGSFDLMEDRITDEIKIIAFKLDASEYSEVERLVEIIKVSSAEDFYVKLMGTGMSRVNIKVDDRIIEIPPSVHFPTGAMGELADILSYKFWEATGR